MKIDQLKCRVRLKGGGGKKDDRTKPAAPSLQFAQPQPMAAQPRIDEARDDAHGAVGDAGAAVRKADPRKVADRVYDLMRNEMTDARKRGGMGKR